MAIDGTLRPLHLRPGEGRQLRVVTDRVTVKATATQTDDGCLVLEIETPPGGGLPAHTQRYDDEAFYVLNGTYVFLIDGREVELGPGAYAFVPRGTAHGYTNVGPAPARMLVLVTPGGVHERFIDEVGDPASRPAWEPDMARALAVAPKYGIAFATAASDPEGAG